MSRYKQIAERGGYSVMRKRTTWKGYNFPEDYTPPEAIYWVNGPYGFNAFGGTLFHSEKAVMDFFDHPDFPFK